MAECTTSKCVTVRAVSTVRTILFSRQSSPILLLFIIILFLLAENLDVTAGDNIVEVSNLSVKSSTLMLKPWP